MDMYSARKGPYQCTGLSTSRLADCCQSSNLNGHVQCSEGSIPVYRSFDKQIGRLLSIIESQWTCTVLGRVHTSVQVFRQADWQIAVNHRISVDMYSARKGPYQCTGLSTSRLADCCQSSNLR